MSSAYFRLQPGSYCSGETQVSGDKSISHRAVMLASLAEGESQICGFLHSSDCEATLSAMQNMGVQIDRVDEANVKINGAGLRGLCAPSNVLDMGNSGTAMRLMAGILCGQNFSSSLIGDASLSKRPMQRIQVPLKEMGADIASDENYTPPLMIHPVDHLNAIHYELPVPSAQVKSCILLAALFAQGKTCVKELVSTRDHTERMLQSFAYPIDLNDRSICLLGNGKLLANTIQVPGDLSSAAFLIVAALISKYAELTIRHVGINPTRDGVIQILREMGANIEIKNQTNFGKEPVADIVVQNSELHGIEIPSHLIANAIDEFPIIFIAAACAKGITTLKGAEELRVKESDRIATMAKGLRTLGIDVMEESDGIVINGGYFKGGEIDSVGDHRIAMAFAIASIQSDGEIIVHDIENVATSFPDFVSISAKLGLNISQHE